MQTASVDKNYD